MSWIVLFIAGLLEVVWAVGLKYTHGFSRLVPSVITIVAMVASMALLSWAMKTLPVGTAYAVWTGIGAVGAAVTGIVLLGESASAMRIASLVCIVIGIIGLKDQRALIIALIDPDQFADIKALSGGNVQHLLPDLRGDGRRPGQQPEIVAIGAADQRVTILLIQSNDVIAAVERAEEGNLQRGAAGLPGKVRYPVRFLPHAAVGVITFIHHIQTAVITWVPGDRDFFQPAFKRVVKAGDFIPGTQIALNVEGTDHGDARRRGGRAAGDRQERDGNRGDYRQDTHGMLLAGF